MEAFAQEELMAQRMLLEELGQEKTSLLTHECVGMFADVIALIKPMPTEASQVLARRVNAWRTIEALSML